MVALKHGASNRDLTIVFVKYFFKNIRITREKWIKTPVKSRVVTHSSASNFVSKDLKHFYWFVMLEDYKIMADILRSLIGILKDIVIVVILIILVCFPNKVISTYKKAGYQPTKIGVKVKE